MNVKSTKQNSKKAYKSRTNLTKLHKKNDNDLNYEDNPATSKEFWDDADIYMPKHKIHISLRLDEDIVNFFKEEGAGYQSRINAVLKAYVHRHLRDHDNMK